MRVKVNPKLADWIIKCAKEAPYTDLGNYMKRYWFFVSPWIKVRVHEILRDDREPHLHSHPWDSISIILKGGYYDLIHMYDVDGAYVPPPSKRSLSMNKHGQDLWCTYYGPGSVIKRKAGDYHQIEVPKIGNGATTLFITRGKEIEWGFRVNDKFVFWRTYLNDWS